MWKVARVAKFIGNIQECQLQFAEVYKHVSLQSQMQIFVVILKDPAYIWKHNVLVFKNKPIFILSIFLPHFCILSPNALNRLLAHANLGVYLNNSEHKNSFILLKKKREDFDNGHIFKVES